MVNQSMETDDILTCVMRRLQVKKYLWDFRFFERRLRSGWRGSCRAPYVSATSKPFEVLRSFGNLLKSDDISSYMSEHLILFILSNCSTSSVRDLS